MDERKTNMEWIIDKFLLLLGFVFKKVHKVFLWKPESPVRNKKDCMIIEKYPQNFALDNGDMSFQLISGIESFSQAVQLFVLTERRRYPIYSDDYGIEEANSIFTEQSVEEFQRQAQNIALHLIDYFSKWIEEIYCISRKKDTLFIEMKVAGRATTLKLEIKKGPTQ